MKKFFWLIIFLIPINCFGISYTEYGDYQYSFSEVKESDLVEVVKEKLYKFYTYKKSYGGYFKEGENKIDYPNKSDDTIVSSFSEYQDEKIEEAQNRIIEEKEFTYYQKLRGIRYITFKYFTAIKNYIRLSTIFISDVKIYYDDKLIDYTYTDEGNVYRNFSNNKFGKYNTSNGNIIIDLGEEYDIDELKVEIFLNSSDTIFLAYDLYLNYEYNSYIKYITTRIGQDFAGDYIKEIKIDRNMKINEIYVDTNIYKEHFSYKSYTKTLYRYQDILFRYYKEAKVYLDGYYFDKVGYVKDKDKFIYRYKYRIRNIVSEEKKEEEKVETKKEEYPQNDNSRQVLFGMIPLALVGLGYFLYKLLTDKGD